MSKQPELGGGLSGLDRVLPFVGEVGHWPIAEAGS